MQLSHEQEKIVQCLYNAWQAQPTGIGLHEEELCKRTGLELSELVKDVQRLKSKGIVGTGHGADAEELGFIWLTDFGRDMREGD